MILLSVRLILATVLGRLGLKMSGGRPARKVVAA
jgi:hypothetical protein